MTMQAPHSATAQESGTAYFDRSSAVTRSLLGYGPVAAVVYPGSGVAG